MKVEIDLLVQARTGLSLAEGDYDNYRIRKAVFWPNGTLHSYFYLSFTTGEWVRKTDNGMCPIECIMGTELRKLLDPERSGLSFFPQYEGGSHGIGLVCPDAKLDLTAGRDQKHRLSEELKGFKSGMVGSETDDPEGSRHLQVSATLWEQIIKRVEVLENENFILKG